MPGLANSYLQIIIIITSVHAVGPAIDVVRRHFGVDHLHEPGGNLDCLSNSSLLQGCVRYNFVAISDIQMVFNIRLFALSLVGEVLPLKCKGTREYVRKPPSSR